MPICDGCSFSFDDSFKFCPQCGRAKPEAPRVTVAVELNRAARDFDCPLCGNDGSVQKVSALVGGGTEVSQGYSSSRGSSTVYAESSGERIANAVSSSSSSSYHKSQTDLAKKLTLPEPPVEPPLSAFSAPDFWGIGAGGLALIIIALVLINFEPYTRLYRSPLGVIGGCILGGIILGFGIAISAALVDYFANEMNDTKSKYAAALEQYRGEARRYEAFRAQWDQLYYCHKHDVAYTTTRREPVPVEKALEACELWSLKDGK